MSPESVQYQNGIAAKSELVEPVPTMSDTPIDTRSVAERIDFIAGSSSGSEIFDEKTFTAMLCLERKRTERSGRRFVLMLLESGPLVKHTDAGNAVEKVVRTLSQSTRETDIKGWYKDGSVFGIIFTELGAADGNTIARALLNKVTDALCSALSIDDINEVRLSFHVFPEDIARCGNERVPDLTLYPDQAPEKDSKRTARVVKRAMDILGSLFALILLSPLLLAIAFAVKLTSRGPVLFRQQRAGRYGARFTFLKFRSMRIASDETVHKEYVTRFIAGSPDLGEALGSSHRVFKLRNDPRVTRVGKLLRRSSLDELPQLFNVLRGDMSLVGPRPPIPYEVACYNAWHKRRLKVKPGITGLWQVRGRSRVKFDEMVRMDLKYADTWSIWLDVKIILSTPAAVLSGEGAH